MSKIAIRLRGVMIALVALGLSAGLAFAAQPTTTGLANAAAHSGKTVPVQADEQGDESADQDTEDSTDSTEDSTDSTDASTESDSADNCATDPTALTADELAAMRHGSVVCWAAQQTTWPEWFSNHGAFVSCWAHQGKADAQSCTEDPAAQAPTGAAPTGPGNSAGHGKGKGHNKN